MQAEESPRAVTSERSGLKPTTAFLLLLLGAALVAVVFYLSKPDPAPTPTDDKTNTAPNFALTNEQAITRFEQLENTRLQSYLAADPSLISQYLSDDSRIRQRVTNELSQLARDRVSAVFNYNTRRLLVQRNTPTEIRLKQVAIVDSRFLDHEGRDITKSGKRELQEIIWTLQLEGTEWLIYDALVVGTRPAADA